MISKKAASIVQAPDGSAALLLSGKSNNLRPRNSLEGEMKILRVALLTLVWISGFLKYMSMRRCDLINEFKCQLKYTTSKRVIIPSSRKKLA